MSVPDSEDNQAAIFGDVPSVMNKSLQNNETPADTRMFMRGTGTLFQAIGISLLMTACGVWAISGYIVKPVSDPPQQWRSYLASEHLPASLLAIGILASFVGGLGLSASGIGLQGERPSSGRAALIVCGCLSFAYWAIAVAFVVYAKQWIGGVIATLFGLVSMVLFLFAWRCASDIKQNPPPADSVVTDEFLEKYRRERAERLSKYNP